MTLAEPMTVATDYALALLAGWLGWKLRRRVPSSAIGRRWGWAFWATAVAALLGGTAHGFASVLGAVGYELLWRSTMVMIGAAGTLLLFGALERVGSASVWRALLAAELAAYCLWVGLVDSDFRYAVWQYGSAMLAVMVIHLALAVRRHPAAFWVVSGIAISFLAAWIQQAGIAPHPSFNHNDLYHVVQMVGLALLYRGAAGN